MGSLDNPHMWQDLRNILNFASASTSIKIVKNVSKKVLYLVNYIGNVFAIMKMLK